MQIKFQKYFLFIFLCCFSYSAYAVLSLELTRGVSSAVPIAVLPFSGSMGDEVAAVIANDLKNSGRFKLVEQKTFSDFTSLGEEKWEKTLKTAGVNYAVVGSVQSLGDGQYHVNFKLIDVFKEGSNHRGVLGRSFNASSSQLRSVSHRISDLTYEYLTGVRGIFSTKLAYVLIKHGSAGRNTYQLEVSDQDGYRPQTLLSSLEPIMSPAWSPDGKKIAYVSFENRRANIYIQNITDGSRRLLSRFPGINGAPAWSPDGKKLALVLSKSGAPNIYIMDLASLQLKQLTHDFYINTEPAFSPDGQSLLYTSNRSGGPQIYQINLANGAISRISYDGTYNARASFAQDGKLIAMIHRVAGVSQIGLLNLNKGTTRVLSTQTINSASPSLAPNGSMVLYETYMGNKNVLAMVSADASVRLILPARDGEAQDPAWSPFL